MNKYLKWTLIIATCLGALAYIAYVVMIAQTKKHSPEETVNFKEGTYHIEVFYNRPFKKNRVIFGELVPYGKVWRTGANEATTFETTTDLSIDGQLLKAGKYTLWTIPNKDSWSVIFNSKQYDWGVNRSGVAKEAAFDVLTATVPVKMTDNVTEQFTIKLESKAGAPVLVFNWDQTQVALSMQ